MSEVAKRPYAQVAHVAHYLVAAMHSACHRIEIAGSLRRKKERVGDIEIVAIPVLHANLIGEPLETSAVDDLLARWPVTLHKNGPKYKAFSFEWQHGWTFHVDLFLQPDPATWGYNFLVRTGPADFSHRMVTPKRSGGLKPDGIEVREARIYRYGQLLDTPEEQDVFDVWGMTYIPPEKRH